MKVIHAVREFSYLGVKLPDISPSRSPEEIKAAYGRIRLMR
jgi:PRTRC genetic system protein C